MDYYSVEMGEGIAGEFTTVGATTTTIYSCMGILFLNETARWGGLYHYPAGRLGNPYVNQTILSMYNQLKAERVLLTPAKPGTMGLQGSKHEDISNLMEFLAELGHAKVEQHEGGDWASYWWDGKALRVNQSHPRVPMREGLAGLEDTFNAQARAISSTVQYYGFNGEKNPSRLSSGSAKDPVPKRKSSKCNIL